jgi:prolyl 4-hydroxylase
MDRIVSQAEQLLRNRRVADAFALLREASASGDARAALMLADLRLSGNEIRRDLGEARMYFGRAAELELAEAEPAFISMLANGAGGSGRRWTEATSRLQARAAYDAWAARQSALLADMHLDAEGDPLDLPASRALNAAPRIETIPGFLTPAECDYLIDRSAPFMQPSLVVSSRTGELVRDPARSASSAGFPFVMEDPALHAINRRIAAATGTTYEQGEPLQILRYEPGEEYKLHSDALPPGAGAQRIMTLLVTLNEDFEDGETSFPHLDLTWRGRPGEALVFGNVDAAGQPEQTMSHAGRPVTLGNKFMLSKWIRGRPLDLSGPPGRPF